MHDGIAHLICMSEGTVFYLLVSTEELCWVPPDIVFWRGGLKLRHSNALKIHKLQVGRGRIRLVRKLISTLTKAYLLRKETILSDFKILLFYHKYVTVYSKPNKSSFMRGKKILADLQTWPFQHKIYEWHPKLTNLNYTAQKPY